MCIIHIRLFQKKNITRYVSSSIDPPRSWMMQTIIKCKKNLGLMKNIFQNLFLIFVKPKINGFCPFYASSREKKTIFGLSFLLIFQYSIEFVYLKYENGNGIFGSYECDSFYSANNFISFHSGIYSKNCFSSVVLFSCKLKLLLEKNLQSRICIFESN